MPGPPWQTTIDSICRSGPEYQALSAQLRSISSPGSSVIKMNSSSMSTTSLCALSLSASQATYRTRPQALESDKDSISHAESSLESVWRVPFYEILLNTWRGSHVEAPSCSAMLLFHIIHLNMFVCLPTVQDVAQEVLRHSSTNLTRTSSSMEYSLTTKWESQSCFRGEDERDKALWHAHRVFEVAKTMSSHKADPSVPKSHRCKTKDGHDADAVDRSLPPHYPHCVFLAALCFWLADNYFTSDKSIRTLGHSAHGNSEPWELQLGQVLLTRSSCGMAKVYQNILAYLGSTT